MGKQNSTPRKVNVALKVNPRYKLIIDVLAYNNGKKTTSAYLNQVVRTGINAGAEIEELKRKLAFYQSDAVKRVYEKQKGRVAQFIDGDGNIRSAVTVNKIEDIQLVLIESYNAWCAIYKDRMILSEKKCDSERKNHGFTKPPDGEKHIEIKL